MERCEFKREVPALPRATWPHLLITDGPGDAHCTKNDASATTSLRAKESLVVHLVEVHLPRTTATLGRLSDEDLRVRSRRVLPCLSSRMLEFSLPSRIE